MPINVSPSRLGQVNKSGDAKALFLKKFAGEVLTTFETKNVMMALHRIKEIDSGKTWQFPVLGESEASYHTPGEDILDDDNGYLTKIAAAERTIFIDDLLTSAVFVADIDKLMNHYDTMAEYSTQAGRALANKFDKYTMQKGVLTARGVSAITGKVINVVITDGGTGYTSDPTVTITGGGGTGATATASRTGNVVTSITITAAGSGFTSIPTVAITGGSGSDATAKAEIDVKGYGTVLERGTTVATSAPVLVKAIADSVTAMREKDVPEDDIVTILRPEQYNLLMFDNNDATRIALNRDWGGSGSVSSGNAPTINGSRIIWSNHLPNSNVAAITGDNNGYSGDFSNTVGLTFQKMALGTVKLKDLSVRSDYIPNRYGHLISACYAMGHGSLRPEAAVEISKA